MGNQNAPEKQRGRSTSPVPVSDTLNQPVPGKRTLTPPPRKASPKKSDKKSSILNPSDFFVDPNMPRVDPRSILKGAPKQSVFKSTLFCSLFDFFHQISNYLFFR